MQDRWGRARRCHGCVYIGSMRQLVGVLGKCRICGKKTKHHKKWYCSEPCRFKARKNSTNKYRARVGKDAVLLMHRIAHKRRTKNKEWKEKFNQRQLRFYRNHREEYLAKLSLRIRKSRNSHYSMAGLPKEIINLQMIAMSAKRRIRGH